MVHGGKISTEMKSKIAKYAAENSVKSAVNKFKDQVPNAQENWNYTTVRDWKEAYCNSGDFRSIYLRHFFLHGF